MGGDTGVSVNRSKNWPTISYMECLKNHAVSIGRHAVDGCGEFLAAGEEGTLEALKCAACHCHRNFHRKETGGDDLHQHLKPTAGILHLSPQSQPMPLTLLQASAGGIYNQDDEGVSVPRSSGAELTKRFRTKFTSDQKQKMLLFAERVGWSLKNLDETSVQQFCAETGIKRHVLKVWMHNNKHVIGKNTKLFC